jgi:hypothetical protein
LHNVHEVCGGEPQGKETTVPPSEGPCCDDGHESRCTDYRGVGAIEPNGDPLQYNIEEAEEEEEEEEEEEGKETRRW